MNDDIEISTPVSADAARPEVSDDEMVAASDPVFECEPVDGQAMAAPSVDAVVNGEGEGMAERGGGGEGLGAGGPVNDTDRPAENLSGSVLPLPPVEFAPAVEWVAEIGLAKKMGVDRSVLRVIRERELAEGTDWVHRGKGLYLTQKAARRVAALVGVSPAEKGAAAEDPHLPAEPAATEAAAPPPMLQDPGMVTLVATSGCANPHIVMAVDAFGQPCRVRVRDNRNITAGMELPCVLEEGNLYRLRRACPRFRGRW
jgi:hypothetical protein